MARFELRKYKVCNEFSGSLRCRWWLGPRPFSVWRQDGAMPPKSS